MIDAISRTQSKYIAVHGSGDVSLQTRLEKQAALLEARPEIGLVGCYYTNIVEEHYLRRPRRPQAEGMTLERLLKGNVFSHGEVMYRRDVYESGWLCARVQIQSRLRFVAAHDPPHQFCHRA